MQRNKDETDKYNLRLIVENYESELRRLIDFESNIPLICLPYVYQRFGFQVDENLSQLVDFQVKIVDEVEAKIRLKLRKRYPNFIKNKVPVVELRLQFGA